MAGMTKEDRAEYESRLAACGYWEALSHTQALAYGLASKREFLARKRKEEALATLSDGERAYALEILADGATLEDAIEAAKEAAKRLEEVEEAEALAAVYGGRAYALESLEQVFEDLVEAAEAAKETETMHPDFDFADWQPETEKAFYTFQWRKEDGGDFYLQSFEAGNLSIALQRWQDFWGLDESTCFLFEVKKGGSR
jgi:hypothetical protein